MVQHALISGTVHLAAGQVHAELLRSMHAQQGLHCHVPRSRQDSLKRGGGAAHSAAVCNALDAIDEWLSEQRQHAVHGGSPGCQLSRWRRAQLGGPIAQPSMVSQHWREGMYLRGMGSQQVRRRG